MVYTEERLISVVLKRRGGNTHAKCTCQKNGNGHKKGDLVKSHP